jgi:hypothetical protein
MKISRLLIPIVMLAALVAAYLAPAPADAQSGNRVIFGIHKAKDFVSAAYCNNATPVTLWSLPTTNPAVATCFTGTNTQRGTLAFADGANALSAQYQFVLPSDWNGPAGNDPKNFDVGVYWHATATTGNVVWQFQSSCATPDADTPDQAFNTASTVTDAASGVTGVLNLAAVGGMTMTGCLASDLLTIKVTRDPAHASDTMAATAQMVGFIATYRRLILTH